ncbi:long-chain fatty acid--CoA ligase [Nocardia sp. NPDC005998]|uniref:long-chain fatty acid--CoA ligase n=1 Tax=Nocardia sp. NPDC005998 TaxID=3156894 RepID=UPI0033A16355
MHSTMQAVPLQIRRLLEYASSVHGERELLTATSGGMRSATYRELGGNAARLAWALRSLGVRDCDRVATFMWNNQEHTEAYLAVPGMGAVLHPLNIRLGTDQIVYTADHAWDRVVIVDASLLPKFAPLVPLLPRVEHIVVSGAADLSMLSDANVMVHDYDALLAARSAEYPWPDIDEDDAAAICYTSGTTGAPKGVVYSHRSIYLHAMALALPDAFGLAQADRVLAIVPQFHVLAWGLPYAAMLTGASLAMPDRFLAPEPLAAFITRTEPTKAAAVPTVWQSLLDHLDAHPEVDISSLREGLVGGSTCPPALIDAYRKRHNVNLIQAWGMTETSPLGAIARPPVGAPDDSPHRYSQGRFPAQVEARLVGPDGSVLPHDGRNEGEVQVRGPWITGAYYRPGGHGGFDEGWLRTADIGVITADGYLTITDRIKDVIKSGGEWISSVSLENTLMEHPGVREAAVIGVADERWGERPLACVVIRDSDEYSVRDLRIFLAARVPKWQLPERWTVLAEIPKTSVGKYDKATLRQRYAIGELPVVRVPDTAAAEDI